MRLVIGQLLALGNPDLGSRRLALPGTQREVEHIQAIFPDAEIYLTAARTFVHLKYDLVFLSGSQRDR